MVELLIIFMAIEKKLSRYMRDYAQKVYKNLFLRRLEAWIINNNYHI